MDPKADLFTALTPTVAQDAETAGFAAVTFTGKLVFNFTITLSTTFPATDAIICEANSNVADNAIAGGNFLSEIGFTQATSSDSTATCTVTIPYSWPLVTSASDMMTLNYTVSSNAAILPERQSTQGIATFKIPASGATTTFALKSTL